MGEDREDRESGDAGLSSDAGQTGDRGVTGAAGRIATRDQPLPVLQREIDAALRYERGLLGKAAAALVVVAIVAVLRAVYFS